MFLRIKNRIEKELKIYTREFNKEYSLSSLSPLLFNKIKEFISRDGKRVRPVLFCIGYLGFAKKPARGIYRSALSLELLHDFMLVHDDIIDKSETRRGKLSMHALLNRQFSKNKKLKFSGEDLTLVIGDASWCLPANRWCTWNATTCWWRSARRTPSPGSSAIAAWSSTNGTCPRSIPTPCNRPIRKCSSAATRPSALRTSSGRWRTATKQRCPSTFFATART